MNKHIKNKEVSEKYLFVKTDYVRILFAFELSHALRANSLALILNNIFSAFAEYTITLEFLEDDHIVISINFNLILNSKVKSPSDFDRKYNSSEIVNVSYNTCRFHSKNPLFNNLSIYGAHIYHDL